MKNEIIRDAYDSVNPGMADIARMQSRLMDALPEIKTEYSRGYAAKPEKTSWWSAIPAAALCFAVFCFGALVLSKLPATSPAQESRPASEPSSVTETKNQETPMMVYGPILKTYETALLEAWDQQRCADEGISTMVPIFIGIPEKLGYAMKDLDADGYEELLITDGEYIYDLYTWKEPEIILLLTSSDYSLMQLCDDNTILTHSSDETRKNPYLLCALRGDGVEYFEQDTCTTVEIPVTSILQEDEMNTVQVDTLIGPGSYRDYVTRLLQRCRSEGRSADYWYAYYDLNEDGVQDLLIGNQEDGFLEAITCMDGELSLLFGVGRQCRICEDGSILSGEEGDSYYVIYRMTRSGYSVTLSVWEDENTKQWFIYHSMTDIQKTVTEQDALDILASYEPLDLEMEPITNYPME